MLNIQRKLFFNGQFVNGQGSLENIINPATGEVIIQVAEASPAQIEEAVRAAAVAFPIWKKPRLATVQHCY